MPAQTQRSARAQRSRAEARRRARLEARSTDELSETSEATTDAASPAERTRSAGPRPSFLRRIVPEAPPLPGKPDPLAGFSYHGPRRLRGVAEAGYLLRQNPLAWLAPAMGWTLSRVLPITVPDIAFLAPTLEFVSLIAAGVLGWQRPWLFGAVASLFGVALFAGLLVGMQVTAGEDAPGGVAALVGSLAYFATLQVFVGALAGWFGGYWRRRLAEASAQRRVTPPPRRRRG